MTTRLRPGMAVRARVDVPLIASGGAGRAADLSAGGGGGGRRRAGGDGLPLRHAAGARGQGRPPRRRVRRRLWQPLDRGSRGEPGLAAVRRPGRGRASAGRIPEGIAVDCYHADDDPMPDSIAEVEFYVTLHEGRRGARGGRGDEQPAGDPDAHRRCGELRTARARRGDPVQRRGRARRQLPQLAVALTLASRRHLDDFARQPCPRAVGSRGSVAPWPTSGCSSSGTATSGQRSNGGWPGSRSPR